MKRSQKPEYDGRWTMDERLSSLVSRILVLIYFICLLSADCYAQSVSSAELINNAKAYDGKTVIYAGEVIGDIMIRGEFVWLNVYDGKNAIGIWTKKESVKDILYTGSYKAGGDRVEITGKFNRSCIEHGGDLDIHARSITKTSSGSNIPRALNTRALNFALGLFCIVLLVFLLRARYRFPIHS